MGTGPVDRHTLNSEYVMYLCHTHNRFINVIFNLKKNCFCMHTKTDTHLTWILIWIENEIWTWNGGSHLWSVLVSDWWFSPSPDAATPGQTRH